MAEWIAACAADAVDAEDVIGVDHDGVEYAIYRSAGGEFFATAGHCTHEDELLCNGLVMDDIIECPRHNGRFDYRTGEAKGAPAMINLRTYPTKLEAGQVYIQID
jgi:3-phenylpropionate/trans-cinnamate dioxygenase ferredoxin subunit